MNLFNSGLVAGALLVSLLIAPQAFAQETSWSCRFQKIEMEGWTVEVEQILVEDGQHAEAGAKALRVLGDKLREISVLLPADRLERMRKMKIVMEWHNERLSSMQYHPSRGWLRDNGYPEELHQAVHIPRAEALLGRLPIQHQPMVILHELSHAWHDQVLDFDHPGIMKVWENFKATGQYEDCLHISGRNRRHYGLTNQKEFFAEMTEAYFGCNDFYPFVRPELKKDLPEVYELMQEVWGEQPYP